MGPKKFRHGRVKKQNAVAKGNFWSILPKTFLTIPKFLAQIYFTYLCEEKNLIWTFRRTGHKFLTVFKAALSESDFLCLPILSTLQYPAKKKKDRQV